VALGVRSSAGAEEAVTVWVASASDLGDEQGDGGTLTEGLSVLTGGTFAWVAISPKARRRKRSAEAATGV